MLRRRNSQQGHATLPSVRFNSPPARRWSTVLGLGAVLVTATLLAFFLSGMVHDPSGVTTPGTVVEPVAAATVDTATPTSIMDSAFITMQGAVRTLSDETASGLASKPLTHGDFQQVKPLLGRAEAALIEIYQLIGQGQHRDALAKTEALVRTHPNFQLAQLVLGDLLTLQTRPVHLLGDVPDTKAVAAAEQLAVLRDESRRRLRALTERPPEGHIPTQFLALSSQSRHAIAIDASRSRLYLFENRASANAQGQRSPQLRLLGDYYISVGLSGIEKVVEGDKRTPLGVYYITSNLDPAGLPDLYGVGALPINYPNPLDIQRGKTGSGIWLHGTPREQFVRAPQASDGCVVMSNPDLERLLSTVQIRTTPVVIAPELHWVAPAALNADRQPFETTLEAWRSLKSQGKLNELKGFYSDRFRSQGRDLAQWWPRIEDEIRSNGQRQLELKDVSMLRWRDTEDTMVVTFGEVAMGQTRGATKRQYWIRESDQWKIFFEGTP
jgi:L,D-peptidoglycan transpeptidase YkuD (ErfK/YbiS/YcfS/YnhG family)